MEELAASSVGQTPPYQDLRLHFRALVVYRGVLEDEVGRGMRSLLDFLSQPETAREERFDTAVEEFGRLAASLLARSMDSSPEPAGDLWQDHLLDRILNDTNPFSLAAERGQQQQPGSMLLHQVRAELRVLQGLQSLSLKRLQEDVLGASPGRRAILKDTWPVWERLSPMRQAPLGATHKGGLKELMAKTADWAELVEALADHYAEAGTGIFGRYRAFRWVVRDEVGSLEGIAAPDPIRVEDLVGYQREREVVLRNTRHFVQGLPANNTLLYGDSGTGKSSLVKALLNKFGDRGLRLVEVPKEHLADYPYIIRQLRGRRGCFIIFVDDFSFEEHETEYKALKALLEGSLEARPSNVLVYATSNRRHLVREQFSDRPPPATVDIHPMETVQEKLSLADRFGIRVAFLAPDQEGYLAIVTALAQHLGLTIHREELRSRATQWAQLQHGFSGRTARQFIDDLAGELAEGGQAGSRFMEGERG